MDASRKKSMENNPSLSLEERLEPWLVQAEWVLLEIIGAILWVAGFVDLFTHRSEPPTILGLYSIPFAIFLVVYSLGFIFWYRLITDVHGVDRLKHWIGYVQKRGWLGLLMLLGFAGAIISMFLIPERWARFPLLEIALLILMGMTAGLVLFARVTPGERVQTWRRAAIGLLAVLALVEGTFQLLSFFGWLPYQTINGLYTFTGRVYQTAEGFGHGRANHYGWYYPEFRLADDTTRIILTGDSYLLGLQVKPEENMGVVLDDLINGGSTKDQPFEVMSLGMPDYGPTIYLSDILYPFTLTPLEPNEVVVLFHLANDFQTWSEPGGPLPFVELDENDWPLVVEADQPLRHDLWHTVIRGYETPNPVHVIQTHLFLANMLRDWLRTDFDFLVDVYPGYASTAGAGVGRPFGESDFMFARDGGARFDENIEIATKQILTFKAQLEADGVSMRLVTIPYFPAGFYAEAGSGAWSPEWQEYDLFAPDRALEKFAGENGIPFLSLGQAMQGRGLTAGQIQRLFFKEGTGRFTAEGHAFVAGLIFDCFYQPDGGATAGCSVD